ncbi:MAG: hypothetical protein QN193_02375 [Armatimonadota bacterium]|nr:hypothetical protein [Armatimonadota bacterium]MDR7440519.1 hypothetical protein [Armatimonadota bacterium]MDR7444609.1 hypothetical protein [Armatimonadota bacterium]MDR7569435.1 hypothetical protein [Armatimonadota bacterium]MDR7613682.1 hypothetical protein [Armatimonadota bacterium]
MKAHHRTASAALALFLLFLGSASPLLAGGRLLLFSDDEHRRFLGCLSCGRFDPDSVHNQLSRYGSRYALYSIWNPDGPYRFPYSTYSACNPFVTRPPVVLGEHWTCYGRLTLILYLPDAIRESAAVTWLLGGVPQWVRDSDGHLCSPWVATATDAGMFQARRSGSLRKVLIKVNKVKG